MDYDRLTTVLGMITSVAASAAAVTGSMGLVPFAVGFGALAAASHAAQGYLTNKPR